MDPQRDAKTIDGALGTLGLKAVDDNTFQVQLARPDPAFAWLAAMPAAAPIRKDVVAKSGDKWATIPDTLLTNGPYRVTEMLKGDHISVERNPYYWAGKATLTRIDFEIVIDGAAALARYKSGELDEVVVQPAQAASVAADSTLSHQLVKTPNLTVFWMVFRVDSPPLDNAKLRQALAQAVDRNAFVAQIFQGEGAPIDTFIPKGMHGYAPNLTTQRYDVAQARASLAASGFSANVSFWQNQQYDNFVGVARTDTQPARRDQEYLQAQSMLVGDAPVTFIAQTVSWYLVQPYVRGIVTSPLDEWPGGLTPTQISIAPH